MEHVLTKAKNTFFTGIIALMALGTAATEAGAAPARPGKAVIHVSKSVSGTYLPDAVVIAEQLHPTANLSYKVAGKRYYPQKNVQNFSQTGRASWYGPGFHGRKTSNGERFDMNKMTAAHPTLPIPSYAKVTNLANGKTVVVRINDRGPFHGNRAIDLSKAAANKLGFLGNGTAQVRIEQISPNDKSARAPVVADNKAAPLPDNKSGAARNIYVSLKTFKNQNEAKSFMKQASSRLRKADVEQKAILVRQGSDYVVRVGPFREQKHAEEAHNRLQNVI